MNKVVRINLNGNAYQLEEQGFDALDAYLRKARLQLAGNPDLEEIMADLEQAIADKCSRFLGHGKTVVTGPEVDQILEEMGPVLNAEEEAGEGEATGDASPAGGGTMGGDDRNGSARGLRKLYRLKDDKMVEGVCSGVAAYFGIDPTFIRIIFVLLLIFSSGIFAIVYLVLVMVVPVAETPEEHAAAHGAPFDARDVMERARMRFHGSEESAGEARKRKFRTDYRYGKERLKINSGLSKVLTIVLCIIGVSVMMKFLYWPLSPDFMHKTGLHVYNPWISILVLFILIYVLSRLIKNITQSGKGAGELLAGVLKFCLVILVVIFAVRIFPILPWLFFRIMDFFRHADLPWHW